MLGPALARLAPTLLAPGIQPYLGEAKGSMICGTEARRAEGSEPQAQKKNRKGRRRSRSGRYRGPTTIGRPPQIIHLILAFCDAAPPRLSRRCTWNLYIHVYTYIHVYVCKVLRIPRQKCYNTYTYQHIELDQHIQLNPSVIII